MEEIQSIGSFLSEIQANGRMTFALDEMDDLLPIKRSSISRALTRLTQKRVVVPVKSGFYAILMPTEKKQGMPSPKRFIHQLMTCLDKPYYVSLLTAAAWHGAAHYAPMTFYVTTEYPAIKDIKKRGVHIHFAFTSRFPAQGIIQAKTDVGFAQVSSPALTMLDLIKYESSIGYLERSAEVIYELAEVVEVGELEPLFPLFSTRALQRLGYILEKVVEETRLHPAVFSFLKNHNLKYIPLISNYDGEVIARDDKWKIEVNEEMQIQPG